MMKLEGEHLKPKGLHRGVSAALVIFAAAAYAGRFGLGAGVRSFAPFVLPLCLIWFSDSLAGWAIRDSGGWLNAANADAAVRVAGWIILAFLLGLRAMVYFGAK